MQVVVSAKQDCAAPIASVFAQSGDPGQFPAVFRGCGPVAGIVGIDYEAAPAVGVGRRVRFTDGSSLHETITAWTVPSHHAYLLRGFRPPMALLVREGHADWRFETIPSGTRVHWTYRFTLAHALAWPLAWPMLNLFMATAMRRCLAALAETTRQTAETA